MNDNRVNSYDEAMSSVRNALDRFDGCSDEEKELLRRDLDQLKEMESKLTKGRVEIVLFGEISTGKSALINAMVGEAVTNVDVQGGWTKEVWHVAWDGCGYCVPGLTGSQVVLVDTPGLNEVDGASRATMAREAAQRADLIIFVTDSDLNETEFSALTELAAAHKPILLAFNKIDLYPPDQRSRVREALDQRLAGMIPADHVVTTAADPREKEYVIESVDGSCKSEWRKPAADVEGLKTRILEVLERDGLSLLALNAAMYAADKTDRIASMKVQLRDDKATKTIWSYAVIKSVAVAVNIVPGVDILTGSAVDVTMVVTLAHIYGLELNWMNARKLVASILKAAGWVMLGEVLVNVASSTFKGLTLGYGTVLTALPQGAAAGYGSYIVGQAAKYYFEHGSSWGGEAPKQVVTRILDETDKESVLEHLKEEIQKKIRLNRYAKE